MLKKWFAKLEVLLSLGAAFFGFPVSAASEQTPTPTGVPNAQTGDVIALGVVIGIIAIALVLIIITLVMKKRKK